MTGFHEENPRSIKRAQIVVAVQSQSHSEGKRISLATEKVNQGLIEFFPRWNSIILHSGYHPDDGTREAFMGVKTEVPKVYLSTPERGEGKGSILQSLFRKAFALDAKALILIDADNTRLTPQWIGSLGNPLFRSFGFVAPLEVRHPFDGILTKKIAYPLIRALFGRRVHQPIGGDFGFSRRMVGLCLRDICWNDRVTPQGIGVWMAALAMNHQIRICQSFVDGSRTAKPDEFAEDPGPTFSQVLGAIFDLMDLYAKKWREVKWSKPTAVSGLEMQEVTVSSECTIDKDRLYEQFIGGFGTSADLWVNVLSPEVFSRLSHVAGLGESRFDFPTELWAKILFEYGAAFRRSRGESSLLLDSLRPLYCGKVLRYVNKVEPMSIQQAEEYVEHQCLIFEEAKPYLVARWENTKGNSHGKDPDRR